jgi:hypothetical protein
MNSATLTKAGRSVSVEAARPETAARADDGFHAWHFFVLVSILLATVAVVMTRRSTPEHLVLLSVTIAAAGLAAGAFYRMLLPLTTSDLSSLDQPMTDRHRATLERDKALTLRAIKDLEFDRAMGKMSQKDCDEMIGRLRLRAMSIMQQLDEGHSYAPVIEAELSKRLGTRATNDDPRTANNDPRTAAIAAVCGCGAVNDEDAVFCKKCGTRVLA